MCSVCVCVCIRKCKVSSFCLASVHGSDLYRRVYLGSRTVIGVGQAVDASPEWCLRGANHATNGPLELHSPNYTTRVAFPRPFVPRYAVYVAPETPAFYIYPLIPLAHIYLTSESSQLALLAPNV